MEEETEGKVESITATYVEVDEEEGGGEVKEEMVKEVMKWLELEISCPPPSFYHHDREELSPFVTTNGNEESCGPSFSDSASTVMASFDTRGASSYTYFVGGPADRAAWPLHASAFWPWADGFEEERSMHVGLEEEVEEEDEWLARVLSGPTFELDESFLLLEEKESDQRGCALSCK